MRLICTIFAALFSLWCASAGFAQEEPAAPAPADDGGMRQFFFELLKEGKNLADKGYYYEACVAFNGVLERGDSAENYYKEAEYDLAVNLFNLGLLYSSYTYFAKIVDAGDSHPFYAQSLPWLLRIAQELPGFQGAREYLAAYDPAAYPPGLKNEVALMVGGFHYSQDNHEDALAVLALVDESNEEYFLKSLYLQGVIFARQNKAKESLDAFKGILRYERDSGSKSAVMKVFHQRALISIARIFYSTQDFETALKYYDQVEKYSPLWLQSLFEKSWTYFRLGRFERAMGNLHTLNSPYFEEQYFPESGVLQAVILFTNCRYEDAIVAVEQFVKEYDDLRRELNSQLAQNEDPSDFYYWLASLGQKGKGFSGKLKRIFNLALADRKLYRLFSFIVALDREQALLSAMEKTAVQKELAQRLLDELVTYRELAIGEVGEQARARLDTKRKELQRLVSQAMKVKFEALNTLKEMIEGKREAARAEGESRGWNVAVDEQTLAWPFEGEYWKDELDSYLFRVENLCPEKK